MIIELILLAILVFLLLKIDEKPKDYPPGPWGLPVIGDITHLDLLSSKEVKRLARKYGKVFSIRVGSRLLVFITDFETIKTAFSKPEMQGRPDFFTFQIFIFFQNIGIIASEGEAWENGRRFALRHLRDLGLGKTRIQETVQREASELVTFIDKHNGKPLELTFELNVAVLNVIWQLVANKRFAVDDEQMMFFTNLVNENIDLVQGPVAILNILPWLERILPTFVLNNFLKVNRLEFERDRLVEYFKKITEEHVKNLDPENPRDYIDYYLLEMEKEKDNPNTTFRSDYMDLIASLGDLFVAGSETTSTSLRWAVLLLGKHPEEQKKAQKVIDENVPKDRQPALEDRDNMTYIDAILFEVLRFSSFVAQGVPHSALTDTTIAGYKIPKGAVLIPCHEYCQRNQRYFEAPDDFKPDRFIGDDGKLLTKVEGYAPFSTGRRQCLGESLAKAELFLFLTSILQKFDILPAPGDPLDLGFDPSKPLFNFAKPYKVIFQKR